jgi:DNA-binding transcriptional LysR family regulator
MFHLWNMKNLSYLETFVTVSKLGSFSKAAVALGVPKSTVSRNVKSLEEVLGVQLIRRDPRHFELTDQGSALLQSSEPILRLAENAFDEVSNQEVGLRGSIVISTTADLAQIYLPKAIAKFSAEYPSVKIKIDVSPRMVDLIKERVDFAIRVGPLSDSGLYARKLEDRQLRFFGSNEYIKNHGRPKTANELLERNFLFTSRIIYSGVTLEPSIEANNMAVIRDLIVQGVGIGLVDEKMMSAEKKSGKVLELFEGTPTPKGSIYIVFPHKKMPKRVAKLVDYIFAGVG